ncbi:17.8 kDa class I heat shock protein [Tritrichomonas foetus]|uniref:17.8 kDa class I heat shock protein n=1 Tax=Tritrichomonas foetus TaxID=1144522 RepID=A0A1J4K9Q7_9EUKA|nr:17.8 kDa class I heat shock protein [Tritrichomonas foetus]|eukprot:OHT08201.1 17.8 kDa class I heat shock protein [Tritrichomonas foetus]
MIYLAETKTNVIFSNIYLVIHRFHLLSNDQILIEKFRRDFRDSQFVEVMLRRFATVYKPRSSIVANASKYVLEYELPGIKKEDLSIDCTGEKIIVKGQKNVPAEHSSMKILRNERTFGQFERMFSLPPDSDVDNIEAQLSDGVLTVSIPRGTSKKIQITIK